MKREIRDVAHSVRARLTNIAHARGEEFQRVLERYAMERILDRLSRTPHRETLVLKGAALWNVWGGPAFRPTRDLDFLGRGSPDPAAVLVQFQEILAAPSSDDGLRFPQELVRCDPIRRDDIYGGDRVRAMALLGNARIPVQIDVGVGSAAVPPPEDVDYPTLLGAPRPRIRAYRAETSLSEKFEAAVVLAARNGRMKDFYDLLMLPDTLPIDGRMLTDAVAATFRARATPLPLSIDIALPTAFFESEATAELWRSYLAKHKLSVASGLPAVGASIRAFLGPVLEAAAGRGETPRRWEPGGPWG